jgi:hypothetical protein
MCSLSIVCFVTTLPLHNPVTIMSAISSQLSFRSPAHWHFDPRVFNIMDSIYAIAFGLGLRTLIDAVSQDLKLTGSLIGLWEGVITLHFVKKMPKSSDPYIAYGVRLFIDFLITESMERMVLVLIWTAFGLVLADVTPAIWDEVGLNRVWRHFRRDLYTIYDKIPTVAFFPPQRTVRFLPPRERRGEREREREPGEFSPSIIATSLDDTHISVIPPSLSDPSDPLKQRVPGFYPEDYSDTDTDFGSTFNRRSRISPRTEVNDAIGTIHYRLSTMPKLNLTYSVSDLDEGNQSSSSSMNHDEIPDMEEELLVDVGIEEEGEEEKQKVAAALPQSVPKHLLMPPTPSDSSARWDIHRDVVEGVLHAKSRPGQDLTTIYSAGEDGGGTSDDWEKINRRELDEEDGSQSPPTPPAKDRPVGSGGGGGGGSSLSIQIPSGIPPVVSSAIPTTVNRRETLPPSYSYSSRVDEFEENDMYYYPPEKLAATAAAVADPADDDHDHANVTEQHIGNDNDQNNDLISFRQAGDFDYGTGASANVWDMPTSADVAAKLQAEKAAAERVRKEAEEERMRKEAEETEKALEAQLAEKLRREKEAAEEEIKRKEEAVKALEVQWAEERRKKELEDDALRKQKQEEAEQKRKKEEEDAERRKKDEAALKKKKEGEDAERKRQEEEAEQERKKEEEEDAERRKKDEAALKKKKEEEDAERKRQEEAEQKRKDAKEEEEDAERKRKAEDALKKKREEEDAELKRQEAAKKKKEEEQEARDAAEKQRQDEAAARAQKEAEEAKPKSEVKEAAEQAELDKQNADTPGDQAEEKEDDSKTVHGVDTYGAQQHQPTDNVQDSTTPPLGDYTEEESVISAATADPPLEVAVRLERMVILRAQMVELEKLLDDLKERGLDETSPEVKKAEKSLRKHTRQAERRYNAGMLFFFQVVQVYHR